MDECLPPRSPLPQSRARWQEGLASATHNKPIIIIGQLKGILLPAVGPIPGKQKRRKARSLNGVLAKMPLSYTQAGVDEASASTEPTPCSAAPTASEGVKN